MRLNLQCVINDRSLGIWGRETVVNLLNQGIDVSLFPLYPIQADQNDPYIPYIQQAYNKQILCDYDAPSLIIWHPNALAQRIGNGPKIAWTIFELDRLKPEEIHHIKEQDVVLVPSKWAKQIVEPYAKRVEVVPLGVNNIVFSASYADRILTPGKTNFFFCGKIEIRKGVDILHHIFRKAFTPKDNVHLYVSWHNPFLDQNSIKSLEQEYHNVLGDQFTSLPWQASHKELANYMNQMDCGVFPTRAEGWCFPALEMMACQKPIIITNYSGQTEFVNKDNAYLIHITEKESAIDNKWFFGEGQWASLNNVHDQFVNALRHVHETCRGESQIQNIMGAFTAGTFTWANSIFELKNILLTL